MFEAVTAPSQVQRLWCGAFSETGAAEVSALAGVRHLRDAAALAQPPETDRKPRHRRRSPRVMVVVEKEEEVELAVLVGVSCSCAEALAASSTSDHSPARLCCQWPSVLPLVQSILEPVCALGPEVECELGHQRTQYQV